MSLLLASLLSSDIGLEHGKSSASTPPSSSDGSSGGSDGGSGDGGGGGGWVGSAGGFKNPAVVWAIGGTTCPGNATRRMRLKGIAISFRYPRSMPGARNRLRRWGQT